MGTKPSITKLLSNYHSIKKTGELSIGGLSVAELCREFGNPLLIYDEQHIIDKSRALLKAFGQGKVAYATKAFSCLELIKTLNKEGLFFEVVSFGEIQTALRAGVPGTNLVVQGSNKSIEELEIALKVGATIVIDSLYEVERIRQLVDKEGYKANLLLRFMPGLDVKTHSYLATGSTDSKFGLSIGDGMLKTATDQVRSIPGATLIGLHAHIASQILDLVDYRQPLAALMEFAKEKSAPVLSIGGGLGVAYDTQTVSPTVDDWKQAVDGARKDSGFTGEIWVEPGRLLIAQAGLMVYEIGTIKKTSGQQKYISVNGGMNDNPRPALYQSRYEAFLPNRCYDLPDMPVSVVGKCCESGDILVFDGQLPKDTEVGELLGIPVSGAYQYSMSSNYHRLPRPAVVFVKNGQARTVIRRQTIDDILMLDVS